MDQNVEKYRISIISKNNLAVQQTWHIYRATAAGKRKPLDLLGVRSALVSVLFVKGRTHIVSPGKTKKKE